MNGKRDLLAQVNAKMRVISGTARGRPLRAVPGSATRPTADKVKEALFSMIGPYFEGGTALDLYAGSGGLGIEALSRGMDRAVFVDVNKASVDVIRANLQKAGLMQQAEVYRSDARQALKALHKRGAVFDLVFLDPPYRMKNMDRIMTSLEQTGLVRPGTIVVIEHEADHAYPERIGAFRQTRRAVYGDTALSLYTCEEAEAHRPEAAQRDPPLP